MFNFTTKFSFWANLPTLHTSSSAKAELSLGVIHKGHPLKMEIFRPHLPPLSGVVCSGNTPPPTWKSDQLSVTHNNFFVFVMQPQKGTIKCTWKHIETRPSRLRGWSVLTWISKPHLAICRVKKFTYKCDFINRVNYNQDKILTA